MESKITQTPEPSDLHIKSEAHVANELGLVPLEKDITDLGKEIDPQVKSLVTDAPSEIVAAADNFVNVLLSTQYDNGQKQLAVDQLGLQTQKEAAHRSAMLKEPMNNLYKESQKGEGKTVGDGLIELKQRMLDLDPVKFGLSVKRIQTFLGKSKIGKMIDKYWTKAQSMQTVIDTIVKSIEEGAATLQRDNETYADDQAAMREATLKLKHVIQMATLIDEGIEKKLNDGSIASPDDIKFIQQEILFPVRKRIMSLQQTLLANQQSILTSEIIISTNRELIRGANDAKNISVIQLQNVMSLIIGLYHQRDMLTKLKDLNATTEHFMNFGSELLDSQATEVNKMASQVMISLETLEKCMAHITSAFDKIDNFRRDALPQMAHSVVQMDKMIAFNEKEIKKREKGDLARAQLKIDIES